MIGRTIGKYRFVEALGRGGMGTVYKAVDETLDREVAVKVLNADLLDSAGVARFRAEAVTLAKLNHPHIAQVYDLTHDGDDILMVMEFVRGETFERLISRSGAMPVDRAADLMAKVLAALRHAHAAGIVHRDLKPANLMLTPADDVKVMDFGIARVQGSAHLTHSGFMMGTPAYMAPEQVRGEDVDARTDVYALGVVLYRMVTGQLPFKADTALAMIHKQLNDQPTPSRQFRADIPVWFDEVLHRALAKDPGQRFQTADDLRVALQRSAGAAQELATLPPAPTPGPWRAAAATAPTVAVSQTDGPKTAAGGQTTVTLQKRHLAAGAALAALLVLVVGGLLFLALRGSSPAPVSESSSPAASSPPAPVASAPATPVGPAAPGVAPAPVGSVPPPVAETVRPSRPATAARSRPTDGPPAAVPPAAASPAEVPPAAAVVLPDPPAPSAPASGSLRDTPLTFKDVKLVVPEGDKVKEYDVVLELQEGRVWAESARNPRVSTSMPYRSLVSATYSRSKHPRWKEGIGVAVAAGVFSAPLFFMKSTAHWLTLQSRDHYFVLHLDKNNVSSILPALETRTGVTVRRQDGDK